jgi:radical SAM protein with 4Fe4S-binding SPASM domain
MCARRYWDREINEIGDMPIGLFREKILPFLDATQTVNLQCLGEPLMGKYFFEMLDSCVEKGCRVTFITNGLGLAKHAERIVSLNVDSMPVSIDGIECLPRIRGITIDEIKKGVREVNAAKKRLGRDTPVISINYVLMKDNVAELPAVVELANELDIKSITVMHIVVHSAELIEQSVFKHRGAAVNYFKEASEKAARLGIGLILPPLEKTTMPCRQPFSMLYINWNGDVRPCCSATINEKDTLKLGNLKTATLAQLWNCREMRALRLSLLWGKDLPKFCRMCAMRVYSLESHTRLL